MIEAKKKHKMVPNAQEKMMKEKDKGKIILHSPWCQDECKRS